MEAKLTKLKAKSQASRLSGVQGASQQRTELYMKYSEGAAQMATQQSAKSVGRATGFASRQADAARSL